jgi:hypothetical protein
MEEEKRVLPRTAVTIAAAAAAKGQGTTKTVGFDGNVVHQPENEGAWAHNNDSDSFAYPSPYTNTLAHFHSITLLFHSIGGFFFSYDVNKPYEDN